MIQLVLNREIVLDRQFGDEPSTERSRVSTIVPDHIHQAQTDFVVICRAGSGRVQVDRIEGGVTCLNDQPADVGQAGIDQRFVRCQRTVGSVRGAECPVAKQQRVVHVIDVPLGFGSEICAAVPTKAVGVLVRGSQPKSELLVSDIVTAVCRVVEAEDLVVPGNPGTRRATGGQADRWLAFVPDHAHAASEIRGNGFVIDEATDQTFSLEIEIDPVETEMHSGVSLDRVRAVHVDVDDRVQVWKFRCQNLGSGKGDRPVDQETGPGLQVAVDVVVSDSDALDRFVYTTIVQTEPGNDQVFQTDSPDLESTDVTVGRVTQDDPGLGRVNMGTNPQFGCLCRHRDDADQYRNQSKAQIDVRTHSFFSTLPQL
jgi:hypothetical protein